MTACRTSVLVHIFPGRLGGWYDRTYGSKIACLSVDTVVSGFFSTQYQVPCHHLALLFFHLCLPVQAISPMTSERDFVNSINGPKVTTKPIIIRPKSTLLLYTDITYINQLFNVKCEVKETVILYIEFNRSEIIEHQNNTLSST